MALNYAGVGAKLAHINLSLVPKPLPGATTDLAAPCTALLLTLRRPQLPADRPQFAAAPPRLLRVAADALRLRAPIPTPRRLKGRQ